MPKTLADKLRDGLEDDIRAWAATSEDDAAAAAENTLHIIQAHALCRIADALEKLVAPADPKPLIEAEREACAALCETAFRIAWHTPAHALEDVALAIRNRSEPNDD
jgi:hypothetical protein